MLEFATLVYLDVPKTGTRFTKRFLKTFSRSGPIREHEHARVEKRLKRKLHVISCREPLRQYLSLYAYGCGGKGWVHLQMSARGKQHLYDNTLNGFAEWLRTITTPEGCRLYLPGAVGDAPAELVGLQTIRFLRLALPVDAHADRRATSCAALATLLQKRGLMDVVLHQESLTADLAALVRAHPKHFRDVEKVDAYLEAPKRENASVKPNFDLRDLPADVLSYVQAREWLLYDALGYSRATAPPR